MKQGCNRAIKLVSASVLLATVTTGCSTFLPAMQTREHQGMINIQSDSAGMDSLGQLLNGLVAEARQPEGQKSSYFQLQEQKDSTKRYRFSLPFSAKQAKGGK